MKKYLTLSAIIFFSCKPTREITGFATNSKDGVSIRTENAVYVYEEMHKWHDSINNKKVIATCKIIDSATVTKEDLGYDNGGLYKQGRLGKTIRIKVLKVRLIK